ncbi:TetR family transcriptional regulator OS=Lysinibacillus sphaericus OX=1421 GN=LS41612_21565 PE=4 SV=1 [Lysinibacillus sphaericus]
MSEDDTLEGFEYATFLLEELQQQKPKLFIIESLLTPFRKAFVGTEHAAEARDIANSLWRYVKMQDSSEQCKK